MDGLRCICQFIQDSTTATVKRAIVSAYPAFRATFASIAKFDAATHDTEYIDVLRTAWNAAEESKNSIISLVASKDAAMGIKLAACKFIEQTIMLLTADMVPAVAGISTAPSPLSPTNPIASKAKLVQAAERMIGTLTTLLKSNAEQEDVSSALAVTSIRSAGFIIQQRPQFTAKLLPLLLAAAKSGKYSLASLPDADGGHKEPSQAATALQSALMNVYDSKHTVARVWKKKVVDGLAIMGVHVEPPPEPSLKRRREEEEQQHYIPPPSHHTQPEPHAIQYQVTAVDEQQPPMSDTSALHQADSIVKSLVVSKDAVNLAVMVQAMKPALLADLVLAYLPHLPPRQFLPFDANPHEPWITELVDLLSQQQSDIAAQTGTEEQIRSDTVTTTEAPLKQEEQQQQLPPRVPLPPLLPPVPIPDDVLAAPTLTLQQQSSHRKNAVLRILKTDRTAARSLRTGLVVRLAAALPDADGVCEGILDYLLEDFYGRNGKDVCLAWLYMLFKERHKEENNGEGPAVGEPEGEQQQEQAVQDDDSRYEQVLLSILEGMSEKLPSSDRSIPQILVDAPELPMHAVHDFLSNLAKKGPEWATVALIAARDVALSRPPSRASALDFVLQSVVDADDDLRTKAVRLLANRLFPEQAMTATIESFAEQQLEKLLINKGEETKDNGIVAEPTTEQQQHPAQEKTTEPSIDEASRYCALYCALCTKKHSLLIHLFECYASATANGKAAITRNAIGLAKTMGPSASAFLSVVQSPPKQSIDLVLYMLNILTENSMPPPTLVASCLQLFSISKDPRALIPALPALDRATATQLLPAAIDVPQSSVKTVITRLCTRLPSASKTVAPPFSPSELLAALHGSELSKDAALLRKSIGAIQVCLSSPEIFTQEALAATINQLLTRVPLPQLFMRTVIQTLAAAPRLRLFIVGVLGQLAAKQIWTDAVQWRGWLMAAQQTTPESYATWLQLPASVLGPALQSLQKSDLKQKLAAHVTSPECTLSVPLATKNLLLSGD